MEVRRGVGLHPSRSSAAERRGTEAGSGAAAAASL